MTRSHTGRGPPPLLAVEMDKDCGRDPLTVDQQHAVIVRNETLPLWGCHAGNV
jgi:hypothetical protein